MKQQAFAIKEVSAVNNQKNSRLLEIEKEYKIWEELQEKYPDAKYYYSTTKYANDEEFYHYISKKLQSLDEEADQIRRESEEFSGGAVDD